MNKKKGKHKHKSSDHILKGNLILPVRVLAML